MASRKIMTAIKRAVSPVRQATGADLQLPSTRLPATTPFTRYVLDNLDLDNGEYKMFAMTFAPQIQTDCDAKVLDFDDYFHLLGTEKRNALRVLNRTLEQDEVVLLKSEQNSIGRPRDVYLLSVNQMEEVLLAANTEEGKRWRKLVLKIKNLVVQFMKMEMEEASRMAVEREKLAQQQLEEQTSKLAVKDLRLQEMEAVQTRLQATIESQKKREEKKEARKRQQKEPMETVYIMTNMPDDNQGPFKCGKTGGDAKKRAKDMQTGNHEEMRVVGSVKCLDSKLVEDVVHRIFHDYRTNDRLEWFDANLKSMKSVMEFVVKVIDGLNRVDHDEICVEEALERVTAVMENEIFHSPRHCQPEPRVKFPQAMEADRESRTKKYPREPLSTKGKDAVPMLEDWLIAEIDTDTIPGVMTATALLGRFNSWAASQKTGWTAMNSTVFGSAIGLLDLKGLVKKKEGGMILYSVDLKELNNSLIETGKMTGHYNSL